MVVQIEQRKPWADDTLLLLIGPGGVGKSTVGSLLAPLLRRRLIDLDYCFTERFGFIDRFITERGYDEYKITNSTLADEMANQQGGPSILVLSSGFLSMDNRPDILAANRMVVASGYSIGLLPSLNPDEAARIIVARQMSRGYGLNADREVEKLRSRFAVYRSAGDMLVVSAAASHQIVSEIVCHCV